MKLSHIPAALDAVRARGEYRTISDLRMESAARGTGRDGTARLVFHSNDYLGMTHEPAVIAAAREALRWGTGSGGARLTSGASFELSDLEAELARFKGYEAALVFNTGYMTNLGVLYGLADKRDVIFSDSLNHASLIDGCRISRASVAVYPHSDMDALRRLLRDTPCEGERFIITDGVFSMDGDVADLPALAELAHTYHARLLVDDAHATGVIGETGRGTAEYWHLPGVIDLQVGTLSKALGSEGGFLCASAPWWNGSGTARGPSSSPPPSALPQRPPRWPPSAYSKRTRRTIWDGSAGIPPSSGTPSPRRACPCWRAIRPSCPSSWAIPERPPLLPTGAERKDCSSPPSGRRPSPRAPAASASPSPPRTAPTISTAPRTFSSAPGGPCHASCETSHPH